ncbi:MAG: tail fiber domain-containing protein [Candidatus Ochrobactrum gambitense]|nr:MAG: tail fiber domain-containing protein [Candidatus Ochrobactrum gambitense]WEK17224.1 MAG: tail fiber domain-containing protein [Candidatus Ochrobactrum gambitense]
MVSAPKAPDPKETAAAQGGMNRDTATSQQMLNMVDQYNPWGSVIYNQTGETTFTDSQGNIVSVPKFTQSTQYTPEQQAIFDASQKAQTNLANIASEQSAKIQQYLNEPFEFNNQDAETWAYDLASPRILAQQQQNQDALRTQLINSGIRPGTTAWTNEMQRLTNANTDQMNQLALTGRQQAFSEALATRNQPINEITALMSGSQVSNPAQMSGATPQTGVAGVDYTGLVNQKYQSELQNSQNMMGGLFGLGSALIGLSDRRAKRDIKKIGSLPNGLNWYEFRYLNNETRHEGVMSDEVREIMPEAVIVGTDGLDRVDYGKVLA